MKRRDFIRNVAIASGSILLPSALSSFIIEQKLHIVIIGDNDLVYMEEFCEQYLITSFTAIGWDEEHLDDFSLSNVKNIEFDFSSITINHTHPLDNYVIIPQRIKNVFKPKNHFLILCSLYRQEALLSKEIINWLDKKQIDYWFFGTIPLLNPRIAPWAAKVFPKFNNNPKVMIYNTNLYLDKLRQENGDMLFSDAATKCDDRVHRELSNFYKSLDL